MAHCHRMVGFCCREQRKNTTAPILCALLLWCVCIPTLGSGYALSPDEQPTCPPGDYRSESGICCNKCPPGYRFVRPCQLASHRTSCSPCPVGQYTEQMNFTPNCRSCKRCKEFEEEVSKCRNNRNTVCRCQSGFYKDVIDSDTSQCLRCSTCQPGSRQSEKCSSEHDTVCECEKDFYPMQNKCLPCRENCAAGNCKINCPLSSVTSLKHLDVASVVGIAMCVVVGMLVMVGLITYTATKRHTKSKLVAKGEASEAPKATREEEDKMLIYNEVRCSRKDNMVLPCVQLSEQELTRLPDCIPLEINIPELIYVVLELVPATRVKELARGLGVTDVEIERVGLDHRTCKEAHYQMLRVWAERETRGGGVLHRPLMQALLDRLGDMHLGGAVEELDTKYGIVGGQVGAAS